MTKEIGSGWAKVVQRLAGRAKAKAQAELDDEADVIPAPVPKEWKGTADIGLVPLDEIRVPADPVGVNTVLVANIADSIRLFGLIHPIAIREHRADDGGKVQKILVAGRARLEAYKLLGEKLIPCTFFPDDEAAAKYVHLSENLFRKEVTALQEAEQIAELVFFLQERKIGLFGQNVQNVGRPLSVAGKAARELPIKAKTVEARKKKIERAMNIALLGSNIKEEIRRRKLDGNRSALQEIVDANPGLEQFKTVVHLGRRRIKRKAALKTRMEETMPSTEQTQYEELLSAWHNSAEMRKAWQVATKEHRERFINEILRGTSGCDLHEAADLVRRAFAGRQKVSVQGLHRVGARYGFPKTAIQTVIRHLAYKKKRLSWNRYDPWWYMNRDKDWKTQNLQIPEKEFEDHSPPKVDEEPIDRDYPDDDDSFWKSPSVTQEELDAELDAIFPDDE